MRFARSRRRPIEHAAKLSRNARRSAICPSITFRLSSKSRGGGGSSLCYFSSDDFMPETDKTLSSRPLI
jgi:hypothetical protein